METCPRQVLENLTSLKIIVVFPLHQCLKCFHLNPLTTRVVVSASRVLKSSRLNKARRTNACVELAKRWAITIVEIVR
ncbi:unnamed protein product [Cuscuta campestris]|uniref:Uncharacterized protein n=1 Tax=Cuscuta campestris TaxID=132261 RepID=A0A484LXD3_9ASTE|nr:unnamed protein product [Cuscuta campestris]